MTFLNRTHLSTLSIASALLLSACGGGGGSSSTSGVSTTPTTTVTPPTTTPPPTGVVTPGVPVTLSGTGTFDRVPLNQQIVGGSFFPGLNFDAITEMPIRSATVELVDSSGAVLATTLTDDDGEYSFNVESGENLQVRISAQLQLDGVNEVDLKVVDNTSGDVIYAIQTPLSIVPAVNSIRNLNADSGWGGSSYTGPRAAAPFALFDTIYTTLEAFIAVDPDVDFPAFEVQWSTLNRAEEGDIDDGAITSSSFTFENRGGAQGLVPVIRILGDENNNTDEFDVHVVVHEFGHYFENLLSRADSIGGSHSTADLLDARVAFGEGWGNALSAMILEDPIYRDSGGNQQSAGFIIDVEENVNPSIGWYSEGSVQSILYDLFDSEDDGADAVTFGLAPIYGAFTDPAYAETEAFTSIYAFLVALEEQSGVNAAEVEALTDAQLIFGTGEFGEGETNSGSLNGINGANGALPVYLPLPVDGTPVPFCSFDNFGDFNNHGNRRFFRIEIPVSGDYQFTMTQTTPGSGDPDFIVFRDGDFVGSGTSGQNRVETQTFSLTPGTHVMDAHAFDNVGTDEDIDAAGLERGDICYNFTVEAQ